ncbi:MAG: O-antigen ligase family protein [Dysgonamonadaceae bacterium]|jgi:O-antigen ligase|nr:O-antigen ligase family protein [Dysgonamonadaceae bacterium]
MSRFKSTVSLTVTDITVLIFFLYCLLHTGIIQGFRCDPLIWFKWGAVSLAYVFFRNIRRPCWILYAIVIYGLFQSTIAIGQALSLIPSPHRFFPVTGTFGNPGPLGGFLAITGVCCTGLFRQAIQERKIQLTIFAGLSFGILTAGILLSDSRAAFLSMFIGWTVLWYENIRKLFQKNKTLIQIVLVGSMIGLCYLLYFHRPASANSRLLIWRISANMIVAKPLFGQGTGAFDREYMLYQAAYFEQYPESPLAIVADNAAYPYNEWMHVLIELGIVGYCLLLSVFMAGLACRSSGSIHRTLKAGLSTFIVFSFFSYPVEIVELMLVPVALLGSLPSKIVYTVSIYRWMKLAGTGLFTGIIGLTIAGISVLCQISGEIKQLTLFDTSVSTPYCDRYFPMLVNNADFNMTYLSALCRKPLSAADWIKIKQIFPSSETYCRLGEACERYAQYEQAEQFYRKAANMVPARIMPNYHLWRLYINRGDDGQAHATAHKILSQPVKVENTFTLRVKGEMKRYLQTLNHQSSYKLDISSQILSNQKTGHIR